MSQITKKDIEKIAKLARIEIDENACETMTTEVGSIIKWIEQLQEVDTKNVEPLTNIHQNNLRMAADIVADGNITDDILRNSPHAKYNYFSVPKVIE